MQSLSAAFLALIRKRTPPRPVIRATVHDMQLRWSALHNQSDANVAQTDATYNATSDTILRAKIQGTSLTYQVITDPSVESQWETWTNKTGAIELTDVAISADGDTVRIFFERDNSGTRELYEYKSTDGGSNWSSQVMVTSYVSASGYQAFASPNPDLLIFADPAGDVYGVEYSAGAWGTPDKLTSGPSVCTGIGCSQHTDLWDFSILISGTFSGNHELRRYLWDSGDGWSGGAAIAPIGSPQANYVTRWPAIQDFSDYTHMAWVEDINAGGLDSAVQISTPADLSPSDYGPRVTLNIAVDQTTPYRTSIVWDSVNGYIYLCAHMTIYRATLWADDVTSKNFQTSAIASYDYRDTGEGATLTLDLFDPSHDFAAYGSGSTAINAIRPLALLMLERGYTVAGTDTYAPLPPLFINSAGYHFDTQRGETFRITAIDGINLCKMYVMPDQRYYSGLSFNTLDTQLGFTIGPFAASHDGTNSTWQQTLDDFTIPAGSSLWFAISRVMELVGARRHWHGMSTYPYAYWYAPIYYDAPGTTQQTYEFHASAAGAMPFHAAHVSTRLADASQIRSLSQDAGINLSNAPLSEETAADFYHFFSTRSLDTTTELTNAAKGPYQRGASRQAGGYLRAHPHPGLEIGDVITVIHAAWSVSTTRRVSAIHETFRRLSYHFEQTLDLESVS